MFYGFQAIFFLHPKVSDVTCIRALGSARARLNGLRRTKLEPFGKADAAILRTADTELFAARGGLITLCERRRSTASGFGPISFNCSVISAYEERSIVVITVPAGVLSVKQWQEVLEWLKAFSRHLAAELRPNLVQLNGIGEEDQAFTLHPSRWNPEKVPSLFTPISYLNLRLAGRLKLSEWKQVARIEQGADGIWLEFLRHCSAEEIQAVLPTGARFCSVSPSD